MAEAEQHMVSGRGSIGQMVKLKTQNSQLEAAPQSSIQEQLITISTHLSPLRNEHSSICNMNFSNPLYPL